MGENSVKLPLLNPNEWNKQTPIASYPKKHLKICPSCGWKTKYVENQRPPPRIEVV